jgi:hypothetical protein
MAEYADETPADAPAAPGADVEMDEGAAEDDGAAGADGTALPFAEEGPDSGAAETTRVPFITYLASPVVTLIAGLGDSETVLTAHQALLTQSPYFQEACAEFADDGSVGSPTPFLFAVSRRRYCSWRNQAADTGKNPTHSPAKSS